MAKASNRLITKQRFSSKRRQLPLYGGRGSPLVGRTLTGSPLVARAGHVKKPCSPSKGKSLTKSACRSELVLQGDGVKLRLCSSKGKAGPLVSVASPREATEISKAFCRCVKRTKNARACATQLGKGASLGRHRR